MKEKDFFAKLRGKASGPSVPDQSCMPGIIKADPTWQPKFTKRRIEIMVTGQLNRVGIVRDATIAIQEELFKKNVTQGDMELRVTAFLDGCRHSTPWSAKPSDAGAGTQQWHCYQGETRFAQALDQTDREDGVDAVLIYGDRFDDELRSTLKIADTLSEKGTKIYALHVGEDQKSLHAFTELAQRTGGICLQLTDERALRQVLPIMTDYILRGQDALLALETSPHRDVKLLVNKLREEPKP